MRCAGAIECDEQQIWGSVEKQLFEECQECMLYPLVAKTREVESGFFALLGVTDASHSFQL